MIPTMPEAMEDADQLPVDPSELIEALSPLLGDQGDVIGEEEAEKLVRFMKDSPKLVCQSICCNIIKATSDWNILMKLAGSGLWETLFDWLLDAKGDTDVIQQLLEVYMHLPVSINLLKRNTCAKTIKNLSKDPHENVSRLAAAIVDKWTAIIRGDAADSLEKEKKMKKMQDKKRKDVPSNSHVTPSVPSSKPIQSSSASSILSSTKAVQPPSSSSINKTVSQNAKTKLSTARVKNDVSQDADETSNVVSVKTESKDTDKKEVKPKPHTVKVAPVKLRSTGLEQDIQIPPIKKKSTPPPSIVDKIPLKRPSTNPALPGSVQEKKLKLTISTSGGVTSSTLSTSPVTPNSSNSNDVPGKIKLIPAKKPPMHELYESSHFMEALQPKQATAIVRKRRTSISKSSGATSPPDKQSSSGSSSNAQEDAAKLPEDKSAVVDKPKKSDVKEEKKDSTLNGELKPSSSSSNLMSNGKKKKSVQWAEESKLKMFHYFELEEGERVNVNKLHSSFADTKKAEMMMEGKAFHTAKLLGDSESVEDKNAAASGWRTPSLLEKPASTFVHGCNSREKGIQKLREQSVLQALFFSKEMLPDAPSEPDIEPYEPSEPINIPLRDEGSDTEVVFTSYPLPVDTLLWQQQHQRSQQQQQHQQALPSGGGGTPPQFSLPPELAKLLADMASTSVQTNNVPPPPPLIPHPNHGAQPGQQTGPSQPSASPQQQPWIDGMGPVPSLPQHVQMLIANLSSQTAGGTMPSAPGTEKLITTLRRALEPMLQNINALQALVPQPILFLLWPQGPPSGPHGPPGPPGPHMQPPQFGLLGQAPPGFSGPVGPGPVPNGPAGPGHYGGSRMPPSMGGPPPLIPPDMDWRGMGPGPMIRGQPMRPPPSGPMRNRFPHGPRGQICKFFGTPRGCGNGDQCLFIHPGVNGPSLVS